jgi:hypothetical protein
MMTDTNEGVDMMVRSTTTTADVGLDDGDLVLNSTTCCYLHTSDSEEEKQEETETTNSYNGDVINDVDMMDEMMDAADLAPGDEMVSSAAIVLVPRSTTTAAELHRNGNNSSNTNPDEPLVPPVGLTSKDRPSNDSLIVKGTRNIVPSQRPGAYTVRERALGSRLPWHHRMSVHLAAPFHQGSRRTSASERELPRSSQCNIPPEVRQVRTSRTEASRELVAAEISPDTADLEALEARFKEKLKGQVSEIKKQLKEELLQDVTGAELVEERKEQPPSWRRSVWILLGVILIGVVVGVVLGIFLKMEDMEDKKGKKGGCPPGAACNKDNPYGKKPPWSTAAKVHPPRVRLVLMGSHHRIRKRLP